MSRKKVNMHCYEAEEMIIGALLLDQDKLKDIEGIISPADFYDNTFACCFKVIQAICAHNGVVTVESVVREPKLSDDERELLYYMANHCPSTNNLESWAKIIREKAVTRSLKDISKTINTRESVAQHFEEVAEEIRNLDLTKYYLLDLFITINEALFQLSEISKDENHDDSIKSSDSN